MQIYAKKVNIIIVLKIRYLLYIFIHSGKRDEFLGG